MDEKGADYRFPADAIWEHVPGRPPESRFRPSLIQKLVKEGYIARTGGTIYAQSKRRAKNTGPEYEFGPAIAPKRSAPPVALDRTGPLGEQSRQEDGSGSPYLAADPNARGSLDLDFPLQRIVHGSPGSGKSYRLVQDSRRAHYVIRTVFHPESRYSDFVGGLRPDSVYKVDSDARFRGANGEAPGEPYVQYVLDPGPLLKAYHLACAHPDRSVVLIIEELSRANAAHVFGDTLQLLDRIEDSRDGPLGCSAYEIEPRPDVRSWLALKDIRHDKVRPGNLRFPPNLYIWATMNRSDQNARQLDSAFLRRWTKQYMSYDAAGIYDDEPVKYGGATIAWGDLRKAINDRLSGMQGIPEDKLIGPYFLPKKRLADPSDIYEDLYGYIWNDVLKTRAGDFFAGATTYAELQRAWDEGNGAPLGPLGGMPVAPESES